MEHLYFYQNKNSPGQFGLWVRKQLPVKKIWAGKQGTKNRYTGASFYYKQWMELSKLSQVTI